MTLLCHCHNTHIHILKTIQKNALISHFYFKWKRILQRNSTTRNRDGGQKNFCAINTMQKSDYMRIITSNDFYQLQKKEEKIVKKIPHCAPLSLHQRYKVDTLDFLLYITSFRLINVKSVKL